jgi:excisionase family DNA binding protein
MAEKVNGVSKNEALEQLVQFVSEAAELQLVGTCGNNSVTISVTESVRTALLETALLLIHPNTDRGLKALTTQQAADQLGVSRPTLISLLDEFDVPFHTVGRHRRIAPSQVQRMRDRLHVKRQTQLRVIRTLSAEIGEYDADPADNPLVRHR